MDHVSHGMNDQCTWYLSQAYVLVRGGGGPLLVVRSVKQLRTPYSFTHLLSQCSMTCEVRYYGYATQVPPLLHLWFDRPVLSLLPTWAESLENQLRDGFGGDHDEVSGSLHPWHHSLQLRCKANRDQELDFGHPTNQHTVPGRPLTGAQDCLQHWIPLSELLDSEISQSVHTTEDRWATFHSL